MRQRPPILLHILALSLVLSFLVSVSGVVQVVRSWNWLLAAGYYPHPIYVVLKDVFLGLASLVGAVLLWSRLPLAPRYCQVLSGLVFVWFWVDRLLLTRNPLPLHSQWFAVLFSLLLLGFVMVSSWLLEDFMRHKGPALSPGDEQEEENEQVIH